MRTMHRVAGPVVLLLAFAGCYAYVPAEVETLAPGTELRARLSAVEAERLSEVLPVVSREIEGRVVEDNGDGLLLLVPVANRQAGGTIQTLHQRVRLTRGQVVEIELKRLDWLRTGALVAAGAIVVGAIAAGLLEGGTPGTGDDPGGGPDEILVPARAFSGMPMERGRPARPPRR